MAEQQQQASQSPDWSSTAAFGAAGASLGTGIAGLIAGLKESAASRSARHIWEQAKPEADRLLAQLYYNPAAEGYRLPYSGVGESYKWAPSTSMRNLYSAYLNRQYGLPETVGRSMAAQAQAPISLKDLSGVRTSAQARQASRVSPLDFANAALGRQTPEALRQMDIMKGSSQLAAFNLWRAQKLGSLIG